VTAATVIGKKSMTETKTIHTYVSSFYT